MNDELATGTRVSVQHPSSIADVLKQNLQKINHHGQRASSIVKGMLEHSHAGDGKKELTYINALCDAYQRIAYHGMRAKDKSFNADFKTEFDENLPKINVILRDIGRVLLNLINNAFYSVAESAAAEKETAVAKAQKVFGAKETVVNKKESQIKDSPNEVIDPREHVPLENAKNLPEPATKVRGFQNRTDLDGYQPTVFVCTRKINGKIEIKVSDNGPGIPPEIKDKIFQPFFTTKPTGAGTGLGLSLSYDIVKAHGGEIKVKSKEGEGTEFKIEFPIV